MVSSWRQRIYGRVLALYPREFRERFGESMKQTFNDLCRERRRTAGIFLDTATGILRERALSAYANYRYEKNQPQSPDRRHHQRNTVCAAGYLLFIDDSEYRTAICRGPSWRTRCAEYTRLAHRAVFNASFAGGIFSQSPTDHAGQASGNRSRLVPGQFNARGRESWFLCFYCRIYHCGPVPVLDRRSEL
jgi:hypothetical protein